VASECRDSHPLSTHARARALLTLRMRVAQNKLVLPRLIPTVLNDVVLCPVNQLTRITCCVPNCTIYQIPTSCTFT
jgi:hypothetical protein